MIIWPQGKRKNCEAGKTCNYVNLSQFDTCAEVKQPTELRKGSNVFVVASSAKPLFDTVRTASTARGKVARVPG